MLLNKFWKEEKSEMENNDSKAGKSILIVGASSGIGKACANLLADSGNTLYLVARNVQAMEEMKKKLPGAIHIIPHDLNDLDGIKSNVFGEIKKNKIKLNAMVYSAGVDAFSPAKVTSVKTMQTTMDVNCFGFSEMARCFYNRSISEDGSGIVVISSISSLVFMKGNMAYTASKAALNSTVKIMAQEFTKRHIRVNAILPARVQTPMAKNKDRIMAASVGSDAPLPDGQVFGEIPADVIAKNVQFLLSDSSSFTTGELLTIGGGWAY